MEEPTTEEALQRQSLKTMAALERMANAIIEHLTADKQPAQQNPGPQGVSGPTAPSDDALKSIHAVLGQHQKALAIIGTLGGFENVSFGQMEPGRQVRYLAGLTVCRECIGTGWLARDESCKNCKKGYIKP